MFICNAIYVCIYAYFCNGNIGKGTRNRIKMFRYNQ